MTPARFLILAWGAFAVSLAGCTGTSNSHRLAEDSSHWKEIGTVEGSMAGERAAWEYWNDLVDEYDGLFAQEIMRPDGIIDPPRVYPIDRVFLEISRDHAVVEENVLLLSRAELAPDGIPGFAQSLRVPVPPERPSALEVLEGKVPDSYTEAYALGWHTAFARALFDREQELDRWVMDRYAVFRADWLARRGGMEPPRVVREEIPAAFSDTRKAESRQSWRLEGNRFRKVRE